MFLSDTLRQGAKGIVYQVVGICKTEDLRSPYLGTFA
jgi:hypothetical protein